MNTISVLEQMNQIIINTGRKYAQCFEDDHLKFTQGMLVLGGCRKFMKWVYGLLVNRRLLKPLEQLPQEEKERIWNFIKDVCVGKNATREKMHQMVIVFYTIEYFLNNPENKS